ncbi:MAG: sugar ABC transporter permease [Coprobacillus sp.]|nr:sugar ABC transporter permease [Coprobacillus sp.]
MNRFKDWWNKHFNKKKYQEEHSEDQEVVELTDEQKALDEAGVYYDESSATVVRLVSRKRNAKEYHVGGVQDVAAKNNWRAWIYLAPVIILVVIFLIYPLINTIVISFLENYNYATGHSDGFTFKNFGIILGLTTTDNGATEMYFVQYAIPNTFFIVFVTVPIATILALLIAVALNSIKWFQKTLQTIFFLPYVTNTIAVGMVFAVIFADNGIINYIFQSNITWIYGANRWVAMVPLCTYIIWSSLPFKILIFLSGLQGIDKQYYQAAQIDSASKTKVFLRITTPLLGPQIMYILVTSFMGAFKEYSSVVALFNGPGTLGSAGSPNMETIVYYIYDNLSTQTSYAAAAAVFLFVIILIFTIIEFWVSGKRIYY